MTRSAEFLTPSEAARRLNVSPKALRLYERRGMLKPLRTATGWRAYGPEQMARAADIASLRALGLGLREIEALVGAAPEALAAALSKHQGALEAQLRDLAAAAQRVREVRAGLVPEAPAQAAVSKLAFDLPWPWRGERFDGSAFARLNYLVGPLFSGKGQFARRLQASLPNTRYAEDAEPEARRAEAYALLDADPVGRARVAEALAACGVDLPPDALARLQPAAHRPGDEVDGLIAVLTWLWADPPLRLIVDVPERGIGGGLQAVVRAEIRRWVASQPERMLFVVTRSRGVLDLSHIQPDEAVFLFPANHAPPSRIAPFPGSFGYEAAASCLADPDHRASVEGATVVRRRASAA